jgi:hypothetical protein
VRLWETLKGSEALLAGTFSDTVEKPLSLERPGALVVWLDATPAVGWTSAAVVELVPPQAEISRAHSAASPGPAATRVPRAAPQRAWSLRDLLIQEYLSTMHGSTGAGQIRFPLGSLAYAVCVNLPLGVHPARPF